MKNKHFLFFLPNVICSAQPNRRELTTRIKVFHIVLSTVHLSGCAIAMARCGVVRVACVCECVAHAPHHHPFKFPYDFAQTNDSEIFLSNCKILRKYLACLFTFHFWRRQRWSSPSVIRNFSSTFVISCVWDDPTKCVISIYGSFVILCVSFSFPSDLTSKVGPFHPAY